MTHHNVVPRLSCEFAYNKDKYSAGWKDPALKGSLVARMQTFFCMAACELALAILRKQCMLTLQGCAIKR